MIDSPTASTRQSRVTAPPSSRMARYPGSDSVPSRQGAPARPVRPSHRWRSHIRTTLYTSFVVHYRKYTGVRAK
jgi:hypothetical protein